jgi:hypothetical protein
VRVRPVATPPDSRCAHGPADLSWVGLGAAGPSRSGKVGWVGGEERRPFFSYGRNLGPTLTVEREQGGYDSASGDSSGEGERVVRRLYNIQSCVVWCSLQQSGVHVASVCGAGSDVPCSLDTCLRGFQVGMGERLAHVVVPGGKSAIETGVDGVSFFVIGRDLAVGCLCSDGAVLRRTSLPR